MGVYTITEKDKADFEIFFDSDTYANIGTKVFLLFEGVISMSRKEEQNG